MRRKHVRANLPAPKVTIAAPIAPPLRRLGPLTWDLPKIRDARDQQMRGVFYTPVRLAEAMRTDDALFTAYHARVSTQSAVALDWHSGSDAPASKTALERARRLIKLPQHTRESILGTVVNHGVAIGYVDIAAVDTPDGPSIAAQLCEWPLEHVRYDATRDTLLTATRDGPQIPITHGDGRWIVFRKFGLTPWTQDAALLPASLLWAAHAGGLSDWAGASYAHGQPKFIGELPAGVPLGTDAGVLSPEAQALLDVMSSLISGESGAGIRPAGSKTDYLSNDSTAWQVFKELITNRESAAARIYLGTDAILGSRGGAPGVDVAALFGIATTRIQGDLEVLERGYREGILYPWSTWHGYDLDDAPRALYELPDTDADKQSEQQAASIARLSESLKALRDSQIEVTQDTVDALIQVLGVSVPCTLAKAADRSTPIALAPTDIARVVRVGEARLSQGLPLLGDERDALFIADLEAQAKAEAAPPPPEPGADPNAPPPGPGADPSAPPDEAKP